MWLDDTRGKEIKSLRSIGPYPILELCSSILYQFISRLGVTYPQSGQNTLSGMELNGYD